MAEELTQEGIQSSLRTLGLRGRAVCLHSSLRSFGHVADGAEALVHAFLAEGCTLMVPTFSYWSWTGAPDVAELRPERNAWDHSISRDAEAPFTTDSVDVSADMGRVAATIAAWPGRVRGANPGISMAAVGPLASQLVGGQTARDPFAPFRELGIASGVVVLAGVGLERMTLLHAAEEHAGRVPFMRYALTKAGVVPFATGGCSEGFGKLADALAPHRSSATVGGSPWELFPAAEALSAASDAIRAHPAITRCDNQSCDRCDCAIAGGPILSSPWRLEGG